MKDSALLEEYPYRVPARFHGREAWVVLGSLNYSITYLKWLLGQRVSIEEALDEPRLRPLVHQGADGHLRLNPHHDPRKAPRAILLVRSHNGAGPWKRRRAPGHLIEFVEAEAPQQTGEFPVGTYSADPTPQETCAA